MALADNAIGVLQWSETKVFCLAKGTDQNVEGAHAVGCALSGPTLQ